MLWNNPSVYYKFVFFSMANKELTGQAPDRKYRQYSQTENNGRKKTESEKS